MMINTNINAYRKINEMLLKSKKSMGKLASGLRINNAADDAAGIAISEKMRGQIRGLNQAQRNVQEGISLIQTAEGALNEVQSIVQRMRELATEASNDTYIDNDRSEIQNEINQLTSEVNKIANTTEFNTQKLFQGNEDERKINIVSNTEGSPSSRIAEATIQGITFKATSPGEIGNCIEIEFIKPKKQNDFLDINTDFIQYEYFNKDLNTMVPVAYSKVDIILATDKLGNITSTQKEIKDAADRYAIVQGMFGKVTCSDENAVVGHQKPTRLKNGYCLIPGQTTFELDETFQVGDSIIVDDRKYTAVSENVKDENMQKGQFKMNKDKNITAVNLLNTIKSCDMGSKMDIDFSYAKAGKIKLIRTLGKYLYKSFGIKGETKKLKLKLQAGANSDQTFNIDISDMRANALGISGKSGGEVDGIKNARFTQRDKKSSRDGVTDGITSKVIEYALDVSNHDSATAAIEIFDNAIEKVSQERVKLGSYQNRLEHTVNSLQVSNENLTLAESKIRDVDIAKEIMSFSKKNILIQATESMFLQAKQSPERVLQLLR